jgi:uncharacterized protein YebE (UPF0316 family)
MNPFIYSYIIIPFLIFLSRIIDVTIGTLRIVFISKGLKMIAPLLGFIEVLIWIIAIRAIMENLSNVVTYIAYAAGFAMGNLIGMIIEDKISLGLASIRIITNQDSSDLVDVMREKNYGVTIADAEGSNGKVNIIFTVIRRKNLNDVLKLIKEYNPRSFYSIEDVRYVNMGIFPTMSYSDRENLFKKFRPFRKGK